MSAARVAALDVGGTTIKASIIDQEGRSTEVITRPTGHGDEAVNSVLTLLDALVEEHPGLRGVGLVVPGEVDVEAGIARCSENVEWRDVPFRELAAQRTGLPVGFEHDVRAAGVLEREWGAAATSEDVLYAPIGTGVSGAIWVNGRMLEGALVGEIGHFDIGSGLLCACGSRGCVETVATAAAIVRRYERLTGQTVEGAKEVLERAEQGDAEAAQVWEQAVKGLAQMFTAYITVLAPERIVIGGGLSEAGDALLEPLRTHIFERLVWRRRPSVVLARFGASAGRFGAALCAFKAIDTGVQFTQRPSTSGDSCV